jgi:fatty acid desaturase
LDPDRHLYVDMSSGQFWRQQILRILVLPYVLQMIRTSSNKMDLSADNPRSRILPIASVHLLWVASCYMGAGILGIVVSYFAPLLIASVLVQYRGHREPSADRTNRKLMTYDTDCFALERMLIAGGHFNWHALHHMFPEVPQDLLPKLASLVHRRETSAIYSTGPVALRHTYASDGSR